MDYFALLFSLGVGFEAVIFGLFGILYSVYAQHMAGVSPENPTPPAAVRTLTRLCRLLTNLFWVIIALLIASGATWFVSSMVAALLLGVGLSGASVALGLVMNTLVTRMGESNT